MKISKNFFSWKQSLLYEEAEEYRYSNFELKCDLKIFKEL